MEIFGCDLSWTCGLEFLSQMANCWLGAFSFDVSLNRFLFFKVSLKTGKNSEICIATVKVLKHRETSTWSGAQTVTTEEPGPGVSWTLRPKTLKNVAKKTSQMVHRDPPF